jgi:protein-S-isoprenylcysteine O-methyltransferase Ste14
VLKKIGNIATLIASVSGFVPRNATPLRSLVMLAGLVFNLRLMRTSRTAPVNPNLLFLGTTAAYIGFIYFMLARKDFRKKFINRFKNKEEAYRVYEGLLGFLFFMNGASLGYISAARANSLPFQINRNVIRPLAALLFVSGWTIKLWSAKVVGTDIYYWKDMFYGRKISAFVEEGPYKIFQNPMYGIGQLQTYATALWYRSMPGLLAALIYQIAVFSFYFLVEKKFIERVYLQPDDELFPVQGLRA